MIVSLYEKKKKCIRQNNWTPQWYMCVCVYNCVGNSNLHICDKNYDALTCLSFCHITCTHFINIYIYVYMPEYFELLTKYADNTEGNQVQFFNFSSITSSFVLHICLLSF